MSLHTAIAKSPLHYAFVGRAMFSVGALLIIFGLIGRVAKLAISAAARGKVQVPQTLREMYPTLPTWWIPESIAAFVFAAVVCVAGIALAVAAKRFLPSKRRRR
jgi:hypothetical protein